MRFSYLAAALAVSLLAAGAMGGGAAHAAGYSQACAPGYHTDSEGNCQPNIAQTNRYCAPGEVYNPFPGGWFCASPSGRTYYN